MQTTQQTMQSKTASPAIDWYREFKASSTPVTVQYSVPIALTAVATLIAAGFDQGVSIPNLSLIYVLPVVASGIWFGLGSSIFASILGALAYNYFFTTPRFSLTVDDPANVWAIVLLFVTGCVASAVASTGRRHAKRADTLIVQQMKIDQLCQILGNERDTRKALDATADFLESHYKVPVAIVVNGSDAQTVSVLRGAEALTPFEKQAATRPKATGGIYPADQSRFDFWSVQAPDNHNSVAIGIAFGDGERPQHLDSVIRPIATVIALWIAARK